MNEDSANKPPIGRYILIAFLFVVIFIGASYLVFRFTSTGGDVTNNPTPSPTTDPGLTGVTNSIASSGLRYNTILPAPTMAPKSTSDRAFTPLSSPHQPIVRSNISGYRTIAQDGRGNLLFDNLTHDENFALQKARIEADARLRLAQEDNGHALAIQKVTTANTLERQKEQSASAHKLQSSQQASELALAKERSRIELARLRVQLKQARLTHGR